MDTVQIIMLVLFFFFILMGCKEEKLKKRLNNFQEKAITLELFIQESKREDPIMAEIALMMLEDLKKYSFCKKTERIIYNVEAFWKAMFLHLYKIT